MDFQVLGGKTPEEWVRDIVNSCAGQHLVIEMREKHGLPNDIVCTCKKAGGQVGGVPPAD